MNFSFSILALPSTQLIRVWYVCILSYYVHTIFATVPANLKDQTYNWPQAALPSTPGILPAYGIPLQSGAQNVVDLTFGTEVEGATITSVDQLGNVAYFYDLFGDPNNTRSSPVDGIPGNFLGIYSFYNEFLADNVTRNPLAVHQVLEDRLRLVARTAMNGSEPGADYEIGYIRLPTQFKPGMSAEIRLAPGGWPTCRWSWPTFWAFTSLQLQAEPLNLTRWYAWEALENDAYDGFPRDNSTQGLSMNNGTPLYGPVADYSYPDDLYKQTIGDFRYEPLSNRLDFSPGVNPTNSSNPGLTVLMDWTDINTLKYYYNGQLVRIRHCHIPSVISNNTKYYDGIAPPPSVVGESMPMFIMISHQFGVEFNPIDMAALKAYNGSIVANYDILSIRVWDKPSNFEPPSSTPSPGPLPPPQQGPALGDLPQLSSATYVLNVEVVNGSIVDHFGSPVSLVGDAVISPKPLNNREAVITSTQYGRLGGISVQGPAVYWTQNGDNVVLFQASMNVNPYVPVTVYAQFIRAFPATASLYDKLSLYADDNGLVSSVASSYTTDVATAEITGVIQYNGKPDLISLTQSLASDGTVVVGVGYGNGTHVTPASGKGVPSYLISGYTELLLGSGRDSYGQYTNGAPILHGQTVMVALPAGASLSDTDRASIENYLISKWGCKPTRASGDTKDPTTAQLGPLSPPSASTFVDANTATLTVSGGGSVPLVLSQPPQTTRNVAMKLLPINESAVNAVTFTALVNLTLPYATDTNAGVAIFNNKTNNIVTFGLHYQNLMAGSLQLNNQFQRLTSTRTTTLVRFSRTRSVAESSS